MKREVRRNKKDNLNETGLGNFPRLHRDYVYSTIKMQVPVLVPVFFYKKYIGGMKNGNNKRIISKKNKRRC